jgi:Zn-dependent M28 family amino/carboxypeptidase
MPSLRYPLQLAATSSILFSLAALGCGPDYDEPAPNLETITIESLSAELHELAHDSTLGRLVGTPEIEKAADWIATRFQEMGLEPAGSDGYNERFEMVWPSLGEENSLTVGRGPERAVGNGWYPLVPSASASAQGPVAFAGYGIVEPRIGYDSYGGSNVSGKVALILEREPGVMNPDSPFDGIVTTESAAAWRKALAAQEKGAVAVLFVRDVHTRPEVDDFPGVAEGYWPETPRRIERFTLKLWVEQITVPVAQISAQLASQLVASSGRSLEDLAAAAETTQGVVDLPGTSVRVTTDVVRNVTPARNVLAMVEGSDPELADEVVIISAHHDHNGADGDQIFNGADDDVSGIIGMLASAAAYAEAARDGDRPRRTVLFAAWDAEERGLLGAWYHTERPRFPLERIAGVLNLDMIGRNEEVPQEGGGRFNGLEVQTAESNANAVNILGHSRTPELAAYVDAANVEYGLELKKRYDNNASQLLRRSDQWPFLQRGVPAVWFHTGLHPDYHTVDDDADRINYEKMQRIVKLVHETSWDVANAPAKPTVSAPMGPAALQASASDAAPEIALENAYVRVAKDTAPCALATAPGCGERVLVALDPVSFTAGGERRSLQRGETAVFTAGQSYEAPSGGRYYEVAFKANPPPVESPAELIPPDKNQIRFDGQRFFVFEERLEVGDTRARHSHSQRVVIQLNATKLQQWPEGEPEVLRDIVPDGVAFNPPVIHTVKNVGELPLRGIVIELKPEG